MLIDARQLASGSVLKSRFCVVGTGMGGSAVAQKLTQAGHETLLVEAGGLDKRLGDSDQVMAEFAGRPFNRPPTRCIELGGTSNQWHGMCAPLDEIDFEPRSWIPYSGWPIRRRDLDRFYAEAARIHGLDGANHFEPHGLEAGMRARLFDFDFNRGVLENKLTQFRKPPKRWKQTLLDEVRDGRFKCLINAPALELLVDESGSKVEGLLVGAGGGTITVIADVFVICAGTLETPRLLLNSRRRHEFGVGNSHHMVGRFLLDHPTGHFSKLGFHRLTDAPMYASVLLRPKHRVMSGLRVQSAKQRAHHLPNHSFYLRPSVTAARLDDDLLHSFLAVRSVRNLTFRQIKGILTNRDLLNRILVHRFGFQPRFRYADMYFFTEQLPNPNSRVGLSIDRRDRYGYPVARIDWQLTDADFAAFEAYTKVMFEQGLKSSDYGIARMDALEVWKRNVASAAHHVGTARMAEHPRFGVVDSNNQVFGMKNLFIGDASVFTTAGNTNPSLTITALALRLGEHLASHVHAIEVATASGENGKETQSVAAR
jgi:choline dehydrogenase-like flavoprotein